MTLAELNTVLSGIGLPVRYSHFTENITPPYLIYLTEGKETFKADDKIYAKQPQIRLELYAKLKDESLEAIIENILDDNGFIWDSDETYDDNQKLFIIYYYFNI